MRISDWVSDVCSSDLGDKILGDMVALLDTLAIPKMDIVGHDWGGYASWELAIRYPERFRRHFVVSQGHPDSMLTPRSSEDVKANWYKIGRASGRERVCQNV